MTKGMLIVGLALAAGIVAADKVLIKETASSGEMEFTGRVQITEQEDGNKVFMLEKHGITGSKKSFDIDPEKNYRLSVKIKALGDEPSLSYLGVAPLDAEGRYIRSRNVTVVANSITELAAACEPTDTVIKVKVCSPWQNPGARVVAFEVKEDESDLPNFNTSEGISGIEEKDGVYEVTLANPVGKAYPAGTKVRQHTMGGYVYARTGPVANEWTLWEGTLRGNRLRMGTTGKLVLLCNWGQANKDKVTLFDELTIEEIE